MSNPADLNTVPQPDTDKNYFNFKATGLKINKNYAIKFQWVYSDGTVSDWSPGFIVTTSNETAPAVPTSASVPSTSTGSIPVTLSAFPTNARRVDVIITGGVFGTSTIGHSFSAAGVATIAAPAGFYTVQLRSTSPSGVTSTVGTTFTITVADVGETIQSPTNPNGFTSKRILAGIEVSWAGTYASSTFTGFEAINIYAGNSATATNGTDNLGGGGGGAQTIFSGGVWTPGTAGNGGSGIVIIRYPSTVTISGGTGLTFSTATSGSNKITSFTAGTGTISFTA